MTQLGRPVKLGQMPTVWAHAGIGESVRLANWDRLRAIAVFDIIAFHVPNSSGHGVFAIGLPLFLLLSIALGVRRRQPEKVGHYVRQRGRRLLLPWVIWSGIYAVYVCYRAWRLQVDPTSMFDWSMLIGGTYYHLWFLPCLFALGLLALGINKITRRIAPWRVAIGAAVAGIVMVAAVTILGGFKWNLLTRNWLLALPSVAIGLMFGRLLACHAAMWGRAYFRWTAVALIPLTLLALYFIPGTPLARYDLAVVAMIAAIGWPGRGDAVTTRIQPLILGIYLVHPIVLEGLYSLGVPTDSVLLFAVLALGVSAVIIQAIRWTPLRVIV